MIRQIFNKVLKQDDCTPETCRIIRMKIIYKKEKWKKLVTTAGFALCQCFTNCSHQSCKTDFTADSTKRNLKTREDLDVLTQRWTLATYRLLEQISWGRYQNVGRDSGLHERI